MGTYYDRRAEDCAPYKNEFDKIVDALCNDVNLEHCNNVYGVFGEFCPHLQFVRLDALKEKDWPHNIADNSIYVEFKIDLRTRSVEVFRCGHIYLSRHDQQASYLAMCSIKKAHQFIGGKWFRKQSWKDATDLAKKIERFWYSVAETLNKVTDGYPYKEMTVDMY